MPFTGVYGDVGSGKTTIIVYLLKKYCSNIVKIGNFDTLLSNYKKMSMVEISELPETDEIRIVVRDEGYTDFDNRLSQSDENIFNSYVLMQQRKSNMSIVGISQLNIFDIRFRNLEKFIIFGHDRPIYDKNFEDYKGDFRYSFITKRKTVPFTLKYSTAKKVFPLFKTKQKIKSQVFDNLKMRIKLKNPKERNKLVNMVFNQIRKQFELPQLKKEITHDWVKNAIMKLEEKMNCTLLPLEPYIYIRLRNIDEIIKDKIEAGKPQENLAKNPEKK